MTTFWTRLARHLDEGRPLALCTVVRSSGSVPRHAGAHMMVFADGGTDGSIGGAGAEEKVKQAALAALARGAGPQVLSLDLWHRNPGGLDSLCGGSMEVYVEPMPAEPHVLVFGAGHVAHALGRVLQVNEYRHTVIDPRPDYASRERFPAADEVVAGDPAAFAGERDLGRYTQAVLLGYAHAIDLEVLAALLPRFPRWVGLIGSRAKALELRARLKQRGLAGPDVERFRCPIGLPVGAETPGEIATAIAAELIADRRRGPITQGEVGGRAAGDKAEDGGGGRG